MALHLIHNFAFLKDETIMPTPFHWFERGDDQSVRHENVLEFDVMLPHMTTVKLLLKANRATSLSDSHINESQTLKVTAHVSVYIRRRALFVSLHHPQIKIHLRSNFLVHQFGCGVDCCQKCPSAPAESTPETFQPSGVCQLTLREAKASSRGNTHPWLV